MSKILKISVLMLVLFTLCAPSCVDEQAALHEEAILTEARNDIRAKFETDYLNETSLFAYEKTAKQKLADLADYLNLLTDTSLDLTFRIKAGKMIKNTFTSEQSFVMLNIYDKALDVEQLIGQGLENKLSPLFFSIDSIRNQEPFHRIGDSKYSGILQFSQKNTDLSKPNLAPFSTHKIVEMYLINESKAFGSDTLKVWNVRLGNIQ